MAYDPAVRFSVSAAGGLILNSTISDMNLITGSSCFVGGSIHFTAVNPVEIHFQYLLRQCQAQFVFLSEVINVLRIAKLIINHTLHCDSYSNLVDWK